MVHGHCHQVALMGMSAEHEILERAGLEVTMLESGCCGMAGSFGFERDHYDISMAVGERVLLPSVRAADPDTLIVADGFSCREQIHQGAGRRSHHLADVLHMGLEDRGVEADRGLQNVDGRRRPSLAGPTALVGATLLIAATIAFARRRS
jgi:Fe-S oxidoreductase